jgi:transcriptional regulator
MKTTLNKKQIKNSKKQPNTSTLMSELAQKLRIEWCGAKAIDKIVEEAKIKKLAKEADVKVQEELRIKKLRALCNDNLDLKIQSIEQAILNDQVKINVSFDPSYSVKEFYIKMTIDGESYDPFSAETLRVLPPTHPSYRQEVIDASHRKYTISKDAAAQLIAEEEATIIRSAEEKAIIEGKKKSGEEREEVKDIKTSQESEPMI